MNLTILFIQGICRPDDAKVNLYLKKFKMLKSKL